MQTPAPKRGSVDWQAVLHQVAISRALDDLEESTLLRERKVLYQFSARGHDLSQVLLSTQLTGLHDGVGSYYRSRPLLLGLGLPLEEALASTMMRAGGMSEGRDIGVVFNMPRKEGPCVLPACGGVGAQYTPAVGWAQSLRYRLAVLGEEDCRHSIAVAHGGEASTAANGFWAALNIVTTEQLPFLFFIEDNGYGISVPARQQTPGGNFARNLQGFRGLRILDGDASDPKAAAALIEDAVAGVRAGDGPALIRLVVPRLSGHSGQDTQTYKSAAEIAAEKARDPLRFRPPTGTGKSAKAARLSRQRSRPSSAEMLQIPGAYAAMSCPKPAPMDLWICSSRVAYCARASCRRREL
jgi:2-oxoisovalerate dehydrogenase E1 component